MRIAALALAGAVALALAGCTPAGHPTTTPKPSTTPVFASDAAALQAAEKAYRNYREVAELVLADGGKDPSRVEKVATGQLLAEEKAGDKDFVSRSLHSVGSSEIVAFQLEQARLKVPANARGVVQTYACIDVSGVDVLDAQGTSVVSTTRPPRVSYEVTFDLVRGELLPASQEPWDGDGVCV